MGRFEGRKWNKELLLDYNFNTKFQKIKLPSLVLFPPL